MKKISRKDLQGLRQLYPVLTPEEMKHYVGGYGYGDGNMGGSGLGYDDWFNHGFLFEDSYGNTHWYSGYTQEELNDWEGSWPGGWVYGLGYVAPDFDCTGDKTIYGHYDTIHYRYDWAEDVGGKGTYREDTYTRLEGGLLTVTTNTYNPNVSYNWAAQAVVYVNGEKRDVFNFDSSGTYIYTSDMVPLGSVTIDLTQYHGQVRVEIVTSGNRGDSYTGYSRVNGTQTIYDEYR